MFIKFHIQKLMFHLLCSFYEFERENILDFVLDAKAKNPTVVFTVAHSEAEPYQIERLMPYGLKIGTHHLNATGTLQKYPECRTPCVDETVLYNDSIYAELICDKVGIHVDPYILRLTKKIKGDDKIILISDSTDSKGPIPKVGDYSEADDINFDFEGEISGTKFTINKACRNMMVHTGASICQVFKYASTNPARALGLTDRGVIKVGTRADLLLAIKPFLKEEKRGKIDAVIKALTIATTVSKLKGGGETNV